MEGNKKPVKTFRSSTVSASIFINQDKDSKNQWYSVTIQKSYNKGTQENPDWKYTSSYSSVDLPHVEYVSSKAFEFVNLNKIGDLTSGEKNE